MSSSSTHLSTSTAETASLAAATVGSESAQSATHGEAHHEKSLSLAKDIQGKIASDFLSKGDLAHFCDVSKETNQAAEIAWNHVAKRERVSQQDIQHLGAKEALKRTEHLKILVEFYSVLCRGHDLPDKHLGVEEQIQEIEMRILQNNETILGASRSLDLSGTSIKHLPENLDVLFPEMRHLYLHGVGITSLPESIGNLKRLRVLSYHGTVHSQLSHLPESIGKLKSLEVLTVRNMKSKTLPSSFSQLENLRYVAFTESEWASVPQEIWQCGKLETLNLEHNEILHVSEEVAKLKNLREVNLRNNRLQELPDALFESTQLHTLRCANNPIGKVSQKILGRKLVGVEVIRRVAFEKMAWDNLLPRDISYRFY